MTDKLIADYYIDTKDREVFYLPKVFMIVVPKSGEEEYIFDVKRIKKRDGNQRRYADIVEKGLICKVDVPPLVVRGVIRRCGKGELEQAKHYLACFFDMLVNNWDEELGESSTYSPTDYDPEDDDGYDPRFRDSLR